ncbi:hypothetical protein C2G38_1038420 [Gigaspora rosea]|uniref:SWIM-type domain-containing protein n=1 Tax=Gigaspora rosea TaxID=44941 RepID=A0A397TXN0_9GLOM|nr:hypothetical protein C2G38_1038420 [Gigaspora rosea]
MERFYERRLIAIANRHPGRLELSKRFLSPGWQQIDQQKIYFDNSSNTYVVPSANTDESYIVDPSVGTCTCLAALGGTPCKHQAAVAIKYQAGSFNFIPALSLDDCVTYRYIACGMVAEDPAFYAPLRAFSGEQNSEITNKRGIDITSHQGIETPVEHIDASEDDMSARILSVENFFKRILNDIKNNGQILAGIENFKKGYEKSESISMGKLSSYLFQQNSTSQAETVRSGGKIKVQPASVQRRKLHAKKENVDPTEMKMRKKRSTTKRAHNLPRNILRNEQN